MHVRRATRVRVKLTVRRFSRKHDVEIVLLNNKKPVRGNQGIPIHDLVHPVLAVVVAVFHRIGSLITDVTIPGEMSRQERRE